MIGLHHRLDAISPNKQPGSISESILFQLTNHLLPNDQARSTLPLPLLSRRGQMSV